jgi:hypothetical protein
MSFWATLVLLIGLRHQVGGDWFTYLDHIDFAAGQSFFEALTSKDPAYALLNWLGAHGWGGAYFVNTVCGVLFASGLLAFSRSQPRPWLGLTVAVPYLVTVVAMGYSRQGVAIGLAMLGMAALARAQFQRFVMWVAFAALFHKSAVVLLPVAAFASSRHRVLTLVGVVASTAVLFVLLVQESLDDLVANYVQAQMQSAGGAIRVAMNAVPAVLLLFRRRFALSTQEMGFWNWMAISALLFVALFVVSPSSTAVDRLALYWIPLQLFVLARLPEALGGPGSANTMLVAAVVGYSALVLGVWLLFADNAPYWLPYQFYPWVWLWEE